MTLLQQRWRPRRNVSALIICLIEPILIDLLLFTAVPVKEREEATKRESMVEEQIQSKKPKMSSPPTVSQEEPSLPEALTPPPSPQEEVVISPLLWPLVWLHKISCIAIFMTS
jgi:hypothetical protein